MSVFVMGNGWLLSLLIGSSLALSALVYQGFSDMLLPVTQGLPDSEDPSSIITIDG